MMHIYHKTMSRQPQTEMDGKRGGGGRDPPLKAKSHNLNQRTFALKLRHFLKSLDSIIVSFYLITLSLNCLALYCITCFYMFYCVRFLLIYHF